MKAWHIVGTQLRDGRPVPADGEWLEYDGPVVWCQSGLYASERLIDVLEHAPLPGNVPGPYTLCRVDVRDIVHVSRNKVACRARRILWRMPSATLHKDVIVPFARTETVRGLHTRGHRELANRLSADSHYPLWFVRDALAYAEHGDVAMLVQGVMLLLEARSCRMMYDWLLRLFRLVAPGAWDNRFRRPVVYERALDDFNTRLFDAVMRHAPHPHSRTED